MFVLLAAILVWFRNYDISSLSTCMHAARNASSGLSAYELSVFFSVFVFLQFWNMFNARGFETRHSVFGFWKGCREFFLTLAAIAVGQVLIVEFGGEVFRTVPLSASEWGRIIGYTSLLALGGEAVRAWRRRRNRSGARTQ